MRSEEENTDLERIPHRVKLRKNLIHDTPRIAKIKVCFYIEREACGMIPHSTSAFAGLTDRQEGLEVVHLEEVSSSLLRNLIHAKTIKKLLEICEVQ